MLLLFSLRNSASDALLRFGELPMVVIRWVIPCLSVR